MAAMRAFWDWMGRVVMLVLAGMITLSIIGAIAAIPSGSLPEPVRFERQAWPVPERPEEPRAVPSPAPHRPAPVESTEVSSQAASLRPAQQEPVRPEDWLEAITYALLALAGLAALSVLLLWRALIQWRRSAEALEALARSRERP